MEIALFRSWLKLTSKLRLQDIMMNCDSVGNEGAKRSLRKQSTDGGALFGWMIARITPKGKIKFMMKSHAK
eukprot:8596844-Karenia_brevis.AAC.1